MVELVFPRKEVQRWRAGTVKALMSFPELKKTQLTPKGEGKQMERQTGHSTISELIKIKYLNIERGKKFNKLSTKE